jgi:hypothetical protein
MNFGPRDEFRTELRRTILKVEDSNPRFHEGFSSETLVEIEEVMKLYNMDGKEKDSKARIELDLDLFQMEQDYDSSLLP